MASSDIGPLTKAWAAGSAALGSMLLVAAYLDEVRRRLGAATAPGAAAGLSSPVLHLDRPEVFLGGLLGILLVLWLASRCIVGVARPARRVIDEVRRQLKDRPLDFVPDHEAAIEMVSRAALRHMLAPAVVASAFASTRWSSSTTCGSEAESPDPTNRPMPMTTSAET